MGKDQCCIKHTKYFCNIIFEILYLFVWEHKMRITLFFSLFCTKDSTLTISNWMFGRFLHLSCFPFLTFLIFLLLSSPNGILSFYFTLFKCCHKYLCWLLRQAWGKYVLERPAEAFCSHIAGHGNYSAKHLNSNYLL